jgi:hypothetical protein
MASYPSGVITGSKTNAATRSAHLIPQTALNGQVGEAIHAK